MLGKSQQKDRVFDAKTAILPVKYYKKLACPILGQKSFAQCACLALVFIFPSMLFWKVD